MDLVGMQPVFTHVPPMSFRSTIATRIPAATKRRATCGPACPVPITIASKAAMDVSELERRSQESRVKGQNLEFRALLEAVLLHPEVQLMTRQSQNLRRS